MQWTQLHLALIHTPVVGVPFLLCLLGWGLYRRQAEMIRLAHGWMALLCAVSIGLKFTGDFAAESAGDRLAAVKTWVERHEQSADQATTGLFLLAISSSAGWFLARRRGSVPRWANGTVVLLGVGTAVLLARAAHLGGQIHHPEIRGDRGALEERHG